MSANASASREGWRAAVFWSSGWELIERVRAPSTSPKRVRVLEAERESRRGIGREQGSESENEGFGSWVRR